MKIGPLLVAAILASSGCSSDSGLPVLYNVPATTLATSTGKPLNLSELAGSVTVYDFIFTSCAGTCPLMHQQMARLTREIDPVNPVRFVSISVDTKRDTPQVLDKFAKSIRADRRWVFATADAPVIRKLSVDGFKLAAAPGGDDATALLHSPRFILADRKGRIRGYYDTLEQESVPRLIRDIRLLVDEN